MAATGSPMPPSPRERRDAESRLQFRAALGTFCRFAGGARGGGAVSGSCDIGEPSSELWDLLRESEWALAMELLAQDPALASRPLHITQRELMFPLHYALEWGAPVDSVRTLLAVNPGAARRCKGEHAPVNRAVDTALNLFTRRLLSRSVSEAQLDAFLAEVEGPEQEEDNDAQQTSCCKALQDAPRPSADATAAAAELDSADGNQQRQSPQETEQETDTETEEPLLLEAQREFLRELFAETVAILATLFEHMDGEEVRTRSRLLVS